MGTGSSHRARVITPMNKTMVLPLAWNGTHAHLKPIVLRERPLSLGIHTAVQTEVEHLTTDTVVQTDSSLYHPALLSCDSISYHQYLDTPVSLTNAVTQTTEDYSPQDAQWDQFLLSTLEETEPRKTECAHIAVQTIRNCSDCCTQTEGIVSYLPGPTNSVKDPSSEKHKNFRTTRLSKVTISTFDIESQTEPLTQTKSANSADSEAAGVLYVRDLMSPFAHLEKELGHSMKLKNDQKGNKAIQDSIAKLLLDVEDSLTFENLPEKSEKSCREVGVQTDNDPITDEAPEYAARPPPCKKKEMIPDISNFEDIDRHALEAPESTKSSLRNLVNYLTASAKNDIFKVRAFFRWIANNITYDWKYMDVKLSADEVLQRGEGVCKDYCKLFGEMCRLANIRVKRVHGFAKGYDYRPGHQFHPGEDITHAWNAIFIFGAWRLVDTTWGTGYTDHTGKFQRKLNEHFFLTDPEVLIWTHFPYNEMESNYSRWQLLDKPLTLDEFNALPKVTPFFFEYNLRIRSRPQNPVLFRVQTELKIASHRPMRYKYKLYSADDMENGTLNSYVFCQLKEDRLLGSFAIAPPTEGTYYFKVYSKPEWQMEEDTTLKNVAIFLLDCVKAKRNAIPFPMNDVPWGPTQSFFDFKMKLINQPGPVIITWGGKRKLDMVVSEPMLITQQVLDAKLKEIDQRGAIQRDDSDKRITFTITPPKVGLYKLLIFGLPKPKEKGRWRLPLLATFLIDCKLSKNPGDDDPYQNAKKDVKRKKMRIPTVR